MKKFIMTIVFITTVIMAYTQISINRTDFFYAGDRIPYIKYYVPEDHTVDFDELIGANPAFDDLDWTNYEIDSIWFLLPSMIDFEGVFPDANCTYSTDGFYFKHLEMTENSIRQIGTQIFNVQGSGMDISMRFDEPIVVYELPIEYQHINSDMKNAGHTVPISDFEEFIDMIMDYETVAAFFDSVKFQVTVEYYSEFDEYGTMQFVGQENFNGIFPYLREKNITITSFDLLLRSLFGGTYVSIGDIPLIPMPPEIEFPVIDTVNTFNYWTNAQKYPLAEITMSADFQNVITVSHRFCDKSFVDMNRVSIHKVYPNPTSEIINFLLEDITQGEIHVFTVSGELIDILTINQEHTEYITIQLKNGNYIYRIIDNTGKNISSGKFVISR